jgi:hypothetical protein
MNADPLPTEEQRKALCELLADVLVEIRGVAGDGGPDGDCVQAWTLAYAVHNLPLEMYGWGCWSISDTRARLRGYQNKYPGGPDHVAKFDAIFTKEGHAVSPKASP